MRQSTPSRHANTSPHGERDTRQSKKWVVPFCDSMLALCLVVIAFCIFFDSSVRIDAVWKISAASFVDPSERLVPPTKGTRAENICLPSSSVDAHWWVLHAERMLRAGDWRVRSSGLDNAPAGREVHWSSLLIWMLGTGAWLVSLFNGRPPADNVAETALYIGPVAMAAALLLLAAIGWRALGRSVALVLGCAFLTSPYIYRTFHAGEADHHGLVMVLCMASALALLGGRESNASFLAAKRAGNKKTGRMSAFRPGWFWISGAFGGAALWVSAATAIPFLAACGFGAIASAVSARKWGGTTFPPQAWLAWGLAGGVASLAFYLLEYFPSNARWRLEVNHPLYALAWATGGFLVCRTVQMIGGGHFFRNNWSDRWVVGMTAAATILPAVSIALASENLFWVRNRFLLALHEEYISEFQSFSQMLAGVKGPPLWLFDYGWTFLALIGTIFLLPRRLSSMTGIIWIFVPALVMQALAFHQVRWGTAAAGLWVVVAIALIVEARREGGRIASGMIVAATLCAWIMALFAFAPRVASSVVRFEECLRAPLKEDVGNGLLLRDIAHRLIRSGLSAPPVVLSGPNSSTLLSYFGNIRTLGTLYWENNPGLHRAARIFASKDEAEAKQRILEEGVTHIVIPSWENFGNAYARLYSLVDPAVDPELGAPFFKAIAEDQITPKWLRPFAYPIPTETGIDGTSVRIFAVLPQQNEFEFHFYQGIYFLEVEKYKDAVRHLRRALDLRPGHRPASASLREAEERASTLPAREQDEDMEMPDQ